MNNHRRSRDAIPAPLRMSHAKRHDAPAGISRGVIVLPALVLLMAGLDLSGWFLHIPLLTSVLPRYATMKPNTALCLGLLALGALTTARPRQGTGRFARAFGEVAQIFALVVSGLSVLEYATLHDFGIDQWVYPVPADGMGDPAGRMSVGTAVCLALTAGGWLLRDRRARASIALLITGSAISIAGLVGFLFDAGPLLAVPWVKSLAIHTAVGLLLLQIAALASRPDREPFRSLTQSWRKEGRRRQLLFAVTVVPLLVAAPVLAGLRVRLYDAPFALALLLVLLIYIQAAVLWADSRALEGAERKLRRSEERSSRILESIGDAVIVTDADARIERMNPVAESLTEWRGNEAAGRPLAEVFRIVNEETRLSVESPAERVRRLGAVVGLANHTVLLGRAGEETHIDDSSAPIRDDAGDLTGIVLVFRNINDRRRAEQQLRVSDQKLRIALETARLGSWELDLRSLALDCSAVCKANFGRTPEESLTYADMRESVHPEDAAATQTTLEDAIAQKGIYRAEYRVFWPDGSLRWIVASGRVLSDGSGAAASVVGVTLDVTDRHQAAAALLESEKLAAVGRLASSIAHEINNPLEAVTNLLYLVGQADDLEEARGHAELAERELRRISVIANQTLRFHKQAPTPQPVTFEELTGTVLSVYQGKLVNAKVNVAIRGRATGAVTCFEGEIRQVLSNLVGNAIDANYGSGGSLRLRSREGTHWPSGRDGLFITVADTGGGMSAQTLRKIFEPFFTTKGMVGTGLGLWISQEIVQRHGGALRVRSSQDARWHGTVFALFLPFFAVVGEDATPRTHVPLLGTSTSLS